MKARGVWSTALFVALFGCSSAGSVDATQKKGAGGDAAAGDAGGAGGSAGEGAGGGAGGNVSVMGGGPDKGCGYAQIPTVREPGAILIVFDQSSSMEEDENGKKQGDPGYDASSNKWKVTTKAVKDVLGTLPQDASLGMLLFPHVNSTGDYCQVTPEPQVPVGPLSQTGGAISSLLSSPGPNGPGGVTPLAQAMTAGHTYLDKFQAKGQKAVLLVTDGAPSPLCGMANEETANVAISAMTARGYKTFVIGLDGSAPNLLSKTAHGGGTDRVPGCNPNCCADLFCSDLANCCHYIAEGAGTSSALGQALADITSKFLSSCVFSVPKGDDPSKFDPALVNVLVSIDGGSKQALKQDEKDGWTYTSKDNDKVEIHGPTCDEILKKSSSVEILLGCPTGQIK